jgi:hypothetical protein
VFQIPINLIVPFWIYIMAMRRKAYLKPCYCEPGSCEHDGECEPSLLINAGSPSDVDRELDRPVSAEAEGEVRDDVVTHSHVVCEDGHVHKVSKSVPRTKWSAENRTCARCCFPAYVRWRDQPPISPLAKFSVRHAWLARVLPSRFVDYLDAESPAAPEHFALPQRLPLMAKQGFAIFIAIVTIVILFISLGLAIWQSIDPPPIFRVNSTNCSQLNAPIH